MVLMKSIKCFRSGSSDVDYLFEHLDDYMSVLPYMYSKLEGKWHVAVIVDSIKEVRKVYETPIFEDMTVEVLTDQSVIDQYLLEKPSTVVESTTPYEQYMELFKYIHDVVFDPKAVSEIYRRVGANIEELEKAVKSVIGESDGVKVTIADVDKVLLPNKRVYASDIMRVFLRMRKCNYRWSLVSKFTSDLGRDHAYYSLRKYIIGLLVAKNKYLHNESESNRYKREVTEIDALTVAHAYNLFMVYNKPPMLMAILYELERRNLTNDSIHTK